MDWDRTIRYKQDEWVWFEEFKYWRLKANIGKDKAEGEIYITMRWGDKCDDYWGYLSKSGVEVRVHWV